MTQRLQTDDQSLDSPSRLKALLVGLSVALWISRVLIPAEAVVHGDTLWITLLWFLVGGLCCVECYRKKQPLVFPQTLGLAGGLLVCGHLLSGAIVLIEGGQRRAAITMMWEWLALGVSWFVFLQLLSAPAARSRWMTLLLGVVVAQSGLALWQHYLDLPATVAEFETLQQAERTGSYTQRQAAIKTLRSMGVPDDPAARILWENRLKSTEPFGTFALANSLAGFLAMGLFLSVGGLLLRYGQVRIREGQSQIPRGQLSRHAASQGKGDGPGPGRPASLWNRRLAVLSCLLIALALVLTKSRTAWVACICGAALWGVLLIRQRSAAVGRWLLMITVAAAVLAGLVFVAALTGGFDAEVLSEAPKSIEYRLQYWQGTAAMLQDHPVFGVGPGNFRQNYLAYKRPESSEEIADPHQMILDVWSQGGLVAVMGLCLVFFLVARQFLQNPIEVDHAKGDSLKKLPRANERLWLTVSAWEWGAVLGMLAVFAWDIFVNFNFDVRILLLVVCGGIGCAIWRRIGRMPLTPALFAIAVAVMLIHLQGAGGVAMPAITQSLGLLLICGELVYRPNSNIQSTMPNAGRGHQPNKVESGEARELVTFSVTGLLAIGGGLCWITAVMPVWQSQQWLDAAVAAEQIDRNPDLALRYYSQAAEADPFSPVPLEKLNRLAYQQWAARPNATAAEFENVMVYGQLAIERNPAAPYGYWTLGNQLQQLAKRSGRTDHAESAAQMLFQAVQRYPTEPQLLTDYAAALDSIGETASAIANARKAWEYDEQNRRLGHRDRYLPPSVRQFLKKFLDEHTPSEKAGL